MNSISAEQSTSLEQKSSKPWALASLALIMLLSSLGTSIANIGLPALALAFNASFQAVQWVVIAYLLAMTVLVVTMGRMGDLVGRRRLLLMGLVIFSFASLLCGLATDLWMLVVARVLQGVGAAAMMALTMAFVGDIVTKEKTGSAMGLLGTMSAIGTALGPSLGGVLIAYLGWRSLFLVNLPVGLLALCLAGRHLPQDRPMVERPHFDLVGTLLLATILIAYSLAVTYGILGWLSYVLFPGIAVGIWLFVRVEQRVKSPLVNLALFRHVGLSAGFISSSLVATVVMATLVVGPFYLTGALGLDAAMAGLLMSAGPIVSALIGAPAGRAVDRFGTVSTSILGLAGMLLGASLLVVMPAHVAAYLVALAVMTAGYSLFQVANNTTVMDAAEQSQRGQVSGMLNLSRNLGLITGASVMGAVYAYGVNRSSLAHPDAVAAGMHLAFAVAAILVAVALVVIVLAWRLSARTAS